jgi:hypothetical protein
MFVILQKKITVGQKDKVYAESMKKEEIKI